MKDTATYIKLILILIFPINSFGQLEFNKPWEFKGLKENNITEVISAEFRIKKNRKLKDSTLIYHYWIEKTQNRLYGDYRLEWMTTHGKLKNPYDWQYIDQFYDSYGRLISDTRRPKEIKPGKEYGDTKIDSSLNIQLYDYDQRGNRIRETYQSISKSFSVSKYTNDTFTYESGGTQKYTTIYNHDNKPIERQYFRTRDSLRCKNEEWIYNEKGLLTTWISYTTTGEFHTKRYYFYNENDKILKQVDSTGWYINGKPSIQKIIDYEYFDDGTYNVTHQTNLFQEKPDKWSITFNSKNLPLKNIDLNDSGYTIYEYLDHGTRKELTFNVNNKRTFERIWEYNDLGLLIAEYFINHDIPKYSKVTKYYYKKF